MRRALLTSAFIALCGGAFAQSFNSFINVDKITGITVTSSADKKSYDVTLGNNASFMSGGHTFSIDKLFGFFDLSSTGNLNGAAGSGPAGWSFKGNDAGTGGIAGYEGNANALRLNPGQSGHFSFSSLTTGNITGVGFHILTNDISCPYGQTLYITTPTAAPEPASFAVMGLGAFALIRRRRNARK